MSRKNVKLLFDPKWTFSECLKCVKHLLSRATSFFSCVYHNNPIKEVLLFLNYKKKEKRRIRLKDWFDLVAQSFPTLCDPMDCSPLGPYVHGDSPDKISGVGHHFLLQGIFPTQGLNPSLPHCRQILYWLGDQGNPPTKKRRIKLNDWFDHQKKCHSLFINIHFFFINFLFSIGV